MEEIKDHHHIKTREGLCDTQKIPANILLVPHIQTIRTLDPEQNSAYHCITPHQGTSQLLTWKVMCKSTAESKSQHIEDGYQEGHITGTAFVDMYEAYDTMNHIRLIQKLYNTTQDSYLCRVIQNLLSNRRFHVELTTNAADGKHKRMTCHGVAYLHQPYSTSTPTTSRSTM